MKSIGLRTWHKKHEMYYDLLKIDWLDGFVLIGNEYDCSTADFDEVVIEQSTRFKDKHGVDIYDNDIVSKGKDVGRVAFLPQQHGYAVILKNTDVPLTYGDWEVIGNSHENEELL